MLPEELLARRLEWACAKDLGGEAFEVLLEAPAPATIGLAVAQASLLGSPERMVQFSLLFRGPADPLLPQGTYHFRHAALGDFAFFITPVARTREATDYEACFSHAP